MKPGAGKQIRVKWIVCVHNWLTNTCFNGELCVVIVFFLHKICTLIGKVNVSVLLGNLSKSLLSSG